MKRLFVCAITAALLLLSGEPALSMQPSAVSEHSAIRTEPSVRQLNFDERSNLVSNSYPAFGGFYVEEEQRELVIWTTERDSVAPSTAAEILSSTVGGFHLDKLGPVFRDADYRFSQLKAWHDQLTLSVFSISGVVFTDIHDLTNRLRIGIADLGRDGPEVMAEVVRLGIPSEAVLLEEVEPVETESSVQDHHRPLVGGLQVGTTNYLCSLGVVGVRSGNNGFVTNSHCTDIQGGVESTNFGQPDPGNAVGTETVDPVYFTGSPCPSQRRCRYSDSAFVQTLGSVGIDRGRIANPSSGVSWNGTSRYRIVSEWNEPPTGTTVYKVGRTTGKTSGSMTGTCLNVGVSGTNIVQLCEAKASYSSSGGDSGGPVFRVLSGSDVELVGIHWGSGGYFSDWYSGVQDINELYLVSTCASGYSC